MGDREMSRCTHINRSGPLHPSIKIGGASLGQCENEAFPELVVCLEHADKDTLAFLCRQLLKDRDRLAREYAQIGYELEQLARNVSNVMKERNR